MGRIPRSVSLLWLKVEVRKSQLMAGNPFAKM